VNPDTAAVAVSGRTGQGIRQLLQRIDAMVPLDPLSVIQFRIPHTDGASLHLLHEFARVIEKRFEEEYSEIVAEVPDSIKKRLSRFVADQPTSGGSA
jgi:50S ribosomal subunit-associated GTPase HflX